MASLADSQSAEETPVSPGDYAPAPVSEYPRKWCIETWMNSRPGRIRASTSRRAPPAALTHRSDVTVDVEEPPVDYTDRTSLISRLKALRHLKFATLWQGRDRALVVGVQDGGYIGVSLDDPNNLED